jgi:hypothetical protein
MPRHLLDHRQQALAQGVAHEAVGRQQHQVAARVLCLQGLQPGVEVLDADLGLQAVEAALPELAHAARPIAASGAPRAQGRSV